MKKIFTKMMLWAVAATAMVSCANDVDDAMVNGGELTQKITLSAEKPATVRTEMEGTTPYWSVGDQIGVYTAQEKDADNYYLTNDATERATKTTFTGTTALSNTLYVYYPYTTNGIAALGAKVDIPAQQAPTATSFDGKADIMIAKPVTLDAEGNQLSDLEFARLGAIVKVVLKDNTSTLAGQHVKTLAMTAASNLTGRVYLDVVNQKLNEEYGLYHGQSPTVTAIYTEATQYEVNGENATYFVVYPQTLAANSGISFVATTEEYTITKGITEHAEYALESGKITTFTVNLAAEHITKNETVEWVNNAYNLVPATANLEIGDKVVFVAATANKAMGAQGSNNRAAVDVTKNSDNNTVAIDDNVTVFTVESGSNDGTFAFNSGSKYICAASSNSNYLREESAISANSSFSVTILDGIATVKAQGSYTRNLLKYNSNNTIFSCYGSGQNDISIYKLVGEYTMPPVLIVNVVSITALSHEGDTATFTYNVAHPVDGTNVVITDDADWLTTVDNNGTVTVTVDANTLEEARTATITVKYGDLTETIDIQQKAKPAEGGSDEPESVTYTENFTTWTNNATSNSTKGTTTGDACSWDWVGASKQYWSNVSSGSSLTNAITLLKPGSADGTYVLSEVLDGGIKSLKVTARSNNAGTGVNVYVIADGVTHTIGTVNTTAKKTDFTSEFDLTSYGITGQYQIKIANKSTTAYCCIGGIVWSN